MAIRHINNYNIQVHLTFILIRYIFKLYADIKYMTTKSINIEILNTYRLWKMSFS